MSQQYEREIESAGITAESVTADFWRLHLYLTNTLGCRELWTTKGPKDTQIKQMAAYHYKGRVLIAQGFKTGGWNIFGEIADTGDIKETLSALRRHLRIED